MSGSYEYVIHTIMPLTPTHMQVIARPLSAPMSHQAGQYLLLRYPDGGYMPFSIANAPTLAAEIELHIRVVPEDVPTQQLFDLTQQGSVVTLKGPCGDCHYNESHTGPLLLLAAGTGFAPAKAIIEQMQKSQSNRLCYLYWSVKRPEDFYLPELPLFWQKQLNYFHYIPVCTQAIKSTEKNNIIEAVLADFGDLSTSQVYVFGPTSLAWAARKRLAACGLKLACFCTDVLSRDEVLSPLR